MTGGVDREPPPDLHGLPGVITPEDAFVAAANTCHHMMVLWAMERFQVSLVSFECEAVGEAEEFLDKTSWFRSVALRPKLVVSGKPARLCRDRVRVTLSEGILEVAQALHGQAIHLPPEAPAP